MSDRFDRQDRSMEERFNRFEHLIKDGFNALDKRLHEHEVLDATRMDNLDARLDKHDLTSSERKGAMWIAGIIGTLALAIITSIGAWLVDRISK